MYEENPKALLMETGGHFYAEKSSKGWAIYKDGGTKQYSDGSRRVSLSFPVLIVSDFVEEDAAETVCTLVANAMNESGAIS